MKNILIKFGGAAMKNADLARELFTQIADLQKNHDYRFVMVHGGGPEIDQMLKRLNIEVKKIDGLRHTDSATLEVVEMVLAGKVNKSLVSSARQQGLNAVGLSAIDGNLAEVGLKSDKLGFVGEVLSVDTDLLSRLQEGSFFPIVCSVGGDHSGQHYNINADDLAAALAGSLKVDLFLLVTDVPGLMSNYPDPSSIIKKVSKEKLSELQTSGAISSGMLPKVEACMYAVETGAKASLITDKLDQQQLISYFETGQQPEGTVFS